MRARPFRFGVQAASASNRSAWVELARRVEGLGYDTLTMPDHLGDQWGPVPALAAAAAVTTDLRVGALVFDNDFKHPVVLAKELATLDVVSDGRLEVGIGAGWQRTDYDQSGIAYDPAGVRIDRLVEGLAVIAGLFGDEPFSYEGSHYRISSLDGRPKPVQRPGPPLLIGGGGRRMLSIAASLADIVSVNGTTASGETDLSLFRSMTAAAVDEKVALVERVARERGRGDDIELNVRVYFASVTDSPSSVLDGLAAFVQMPVDEVAESPFVLVGPAGKLVEDLLARRERWGFSYVIVGAEELDEFAPVVAELSGR